MNADVKQAWLQALRSGEYQQGRGLLHPTGDTYCCLGVLCDLHAKAGLGMWIDERYNGDQLEALPIDVQIWAGLSDWCPDVPAPKGLTGIVTLAEYNDGQLDLGIRPHTFAEIADLIEAHL